jgi:SprT protein
MRRQELEEILNQHVPATTVAYCLSLWDKHPFKFKLRKSRQTKVGDFICRQGHEPEITVNHDLHPFLFLITYIHEVAHLDVHHTHGRKGDPHGTEWKDSFRRLLQPVMTTEIFPKDLLKQLSVHMENPKASSFSDPELTQALRSHDPKWSRTTILSEIPEGSVFGLRGKWFRKGPLQRTRFVCKEVGTKRTFFVPADFPVENAQLSLL